MTDPDVLARFARNHGCTPVEIVAEQWEEEGKAAVVGCGWYTYYEREPDGRWRRAAHAVLGSDQPLPMNPGMRVVPAADSPRLEPPVRIMRPGTSRFEAECTITRTGEVTDCTRTASAGKADAAIFEWLRVARYEPPTYAGHVFSVRYKISVSLWLSS